MEAGSKLSRMWKAGPRKKESGHQLLAGHHWALGQSSAFCSSQDGESQRAEAVSAKMIPISFAPILKKSISELATAGKTPF